MKKLMIAAAAAATVGGAFAAPQVYDMTITVKATECKSANKAYKNVCADDVVLYRAQATQKFYGKFWGCDCDVIACPDVANYGKDVNDENGYIFWGAKGAFHNAEMTWSILQLVGKQGTNIEGAFGLDLYTCENGEVASDPSFVLNGAGYGTALVKGCANADNYIKSMSGNVVGTYNVSALSVLSGCKYCGETAECYAWDFCGCTAADSDVSAAFGTFTLKYNASQAKAVANGKSIQQANKFKSFVTDEFKCIANGEVTPEPTPEDPAATAKENFTAAKKALEAAEKAYDDLGTSPATSVKGKALQQAVNDATTKQGNAATELATKTAAIGASVASAKADIHTKEAAVKTAEDALDAAITAADIATARAALETANQNLEDAKAAYVNAKNAAIAADADAAAKIAEFEAADAAKVAADKALDEANAALTAYDTTAWNADCVAAAKARDDAQEAYDYARIACAVTGADCK